LSSFLFLYIYIFLCACCTSWALACCCFFFSNFFSLFSQAVAALSVPRTQFTGDIVALGSVGHHGTVLQNQDLATFNVTVRKPCAKYKNYSDCSSDNVTAGGCSWCDIVDHPPFCTTDVAARQIPNPPQMPPHQCS
jgi:hypothetical protein